MANLDGVQPIRRSFLTQRVGRLAPDETGAIGRALSALTDC